MYGWLIMAEGLIYHNDTNKSENILCMGEQHGHFCKEYEN